MDILNKTPYLCEPVLLLDRNGRDLLVVIIKGTFTFEKTAGLKLADIQMPITKADEFYGEPNETSVRFESDIAPMKQGTDVIIIGHAYSKRKNASQVDVSLKVGSLEFTMRVFGDRHWRTVLFTPIPSAPEPFEKIPLTYDRAFGGKDLSFPDPKHHEQEIRNPLGRGFRAKKSIMKNDEVLLPNLEDPMALITNIDDRPQPVGCGFIGRNWEPRLSYLGTYDKNWMTNRLPLLPHDFDERYFNGAHPRLVSSDFLKGNEPIAMESLSQRGPLKFSLPNVQPKATVHMREHSAALTVLCDTLTIEPDEDRLTMVWRGNLDIHDQIDQVRQIVVKDGSKVPLSTC